jgi:hypothetical protein
VSLRPPQVSSIISGPDISMPTLDAHAALVTEVQAACRKAKESRNSGDLEAARLIMTRPEISSLPKEARENLQWAYAAAVMAVTGALAP